MSHPKKWKSFAALITAPALVFLDQTILPVALPIIQNDFNATTTQIQWCINAYLLLIAIFVLVSGKLGDRIGYRNALTVGICGFAISSAFCAMSPNIELFICARALQGISASFIYPSQTALVAKIFPEGKRGKATGMLVSIGSLFLILGPFIGGYLTELGSWRSIFWINLPITLIGVYLVFRYLPATEKGQGRIDGIGFIFFFFATAASGIFLMQANDWGWTSPKILLMIAFALCMFLCLGIREKKTPHPFLDLSLFKRPVYTAINISVFITQFILMISVFQTIYFETILHYSPLQTGLILSTSGAPIFFMAPLAGWLSDKYTPKLPLALGYLALIFSFFLFAFFHTPSLAIIFIALITFGIGIPFIFTPSYSTAIASVPAEKAGVAMGMISTLRMFGGMLGLALIHLVTSAVHQFRKPLVGEFQAQAASFTFVHMTLGFALILAFAATFVLHNRKSAHHLPNSPAEGWD